MINIDSQDTQDYLLQFSFLVGSIFVIANTTAVMYRGLLKFCTTKEDNSKKYTASISESAHEYCNNDSSYFSNCASRPSHSTSSLRHRKSSFPLKDEPMAALKSTYNFFAMNRHFLPIVDERKVYDFKLIKLFSICCLFENVCIISSAVFAGNLGDNELTKTCNISFETEDCIMMNTIFLLRKTNLSSVFGILGLTSVCVFPVIFYLMTHCFKSYIKSFFCSIIILFFVLLSRCFGFLLLPLFIFPISWHGYTLQRLLSSWIVFLSMGIGVKLTFQAVSQSVHQQLQVDLDKPGTLTGSLLEDKATEHDVSRTKSFGKENRDHCSKRSWRSNSEMTFGSDAFLPCVVLMRKQNGGQPYKQSVNVGTSAKVSRTRRRASLDVTKENNNVEEALKWSKMIHKRRTSLPTILAGSKKKPVMSSVLIDTSTLAEVHAIVDELSKKPSNYFDFVKKLQDLLNPYTLDHVKPRQVVWMQKSGDVSDEESLSLAMNSRHVTSKRLSQRRLDRQGDLFSTTTTATGLPKEEPAPLKPKRLPKIPKDRTPIGTPIDSRCSSPACGDPSSYHQGRRSTYPSLHFSNSPMFSFAHSHIHHHNITKRISAISSDYESDDPSCLSVPSPIAARSKSSTDNTDVISSTYLHYLPENHLPNGVPENQEFFSIRTVVTSPDSETSVILEEEETGSRHGNQRICEQMDEGHIFFQNYQKQLLESVYNWNFQIFELAEKTNHGLSQMAFKIFQDTGLFETFNIPKKEFVCYMKALENGYRAIPYHNRIHAADVLHGCWFLSTQEIPTSLGRSLQDQSPLFSSDSSDSDSGTSATHSRQVNNIGHGSLAQEIPALELMSLYLAAAMHDYDHPGRTNAFLVETRNSLANLYNDRSVLENHHASASWKLLYSNKNFDFLRSLETAEWKRLRFLIVEAILATDLKKNFEILSQFSSKTERPLSTSTENGDVDRPERSCINWSADEDRLLVCKMVIKLADIGGPAKLKPIHITWTKAICEEFFIQGDEERQLNVQVSPYMDRENPQVAQLQQTFIDKLIHPIVLSMHKAGILAGEIPEDHDSWVDQHKSKDQNLLLAQLTSNLNFWKTKTPFKGHEEMHEAFKHALPFRLGNDSSPLSSSTFSNDDRLSPRESLLEDDEVFDRTISERDNENMRSSVRDVIRASSDVSADSRRTKLHTPKIIVTKK